MLVPVVVHVKNRVAFGLDDNILIELFQMETFEWLLSADRIRTVITRSVNDGISVVACSLLGNFIYRRSDIAVQRDRIIEVIAIPSQILFPDNDGIVSCCLGDPTSIDCDLITEGLIEVILLFCGFEIICNLLGCIPAAESIAVTDHVGIGRSARRICRINELRRVISGAFAVLIEDKPMSFRGVYTKLNISSNRKDCIVFIRCCYRFSIKCGTYNIASTFMNIPSFKVILLILHGVSHIHFILLLCRF